MNKTAIKNFAIWARNKLISDIQFRAQLLGVLSDRICEPLPQSDSQTQFFDIGTKDYVTVKGGDVSRRAAFVEALRAKARRTDYATAYKAIIEKVAYTWFNRLIAIRFMEVNDYLPGRVRVLSSTLEGKAEPDLVSNPFEGGLTFTEQEQDTILRFKDENRLDELFRMLFIMECQSLSEILPGLFVKKEESLQPRDYYALLLNINFTDRDGLVWHLTHDIPERDFRVRTREDDLRQAAEGIPEEEMPAGQVEIIGWLYQYYNTEPKNEVFAGLKKNKKIGADDIPAATQLFTPDWIVRYMVQNSLGRLWVEGHPDTKERFMPEHNADGSVCVQEGRWNYYLEEAQQEPQVEAQLQTIREAYARLRPEDIKVIDPCCGSGHIAVYLFDVLMQIYETQGWTQREAAQSIVEHNLYALDIDDRAAQLAYFAVMMKARQYDRRFFTRGLQPHVYAIPEWDEETRKGWSAELRNLCNLLRDGKEFGSIIDMPEMDWNALRMEVELMADMQGQISIDSVSEATRQKLRGLIDVGQAMAQKYDVVVTNPPYMAITNANRKLFDFVKSNYTIGNSDMFGVFIERCINILRSNGLCGMITQNSWMFLSSYEKMRREISKMVISSMAHLGARAFNEISGEVVQTTAFVLAKQLIPNYKSVFERLIAENSEEEKEYAFLTLKHHYISAQDDYAIVPGQPIVYWLSHRALQNFTIGLSVNSIGAFTGQQNITADNEKYLRNSWEVRKDEIGNGHKWIFYIKGGLFRRWYGNIDFVVDWSEPAKAFYKSNPNGKLLPADLCFAEGITYTEISSGANSFRYLPPIGAFDKKGPSIVHLQHQYYCLGFFNSCVAAYYFNAINPTISLQIRDVKNTPVVISDRYYESVNECVRDNISICKTDWDSFETSWDFQRHPLLDVISRGGPFFERGNIDLAECWLLWKGECEERFQQLKSNEEELNRIFIDIYGLQDELTPEVEDKDVTVRRADLGRDIRSLISYAVGCMFGRYSLDVPGLVYAGGSFDQKYCRWIRQFGDEADKYIDENGQIKDGWAGSSMWEYDGVRIDGHWRKATFAPDTDNCIPITDEPYFEDDIVGRFVEFIRVVYGDASLETNLGFIAHALGNKGDTSRDVIRNYFLNDFFKDHCQTYSVTGSGKRPIYWLFDSGKANGFKALVYMHRWNADTVGNLRVEYLHRMQRVYEKEIERMQDTIDNARDSREVARATKRREKLVKQLKEARDYDAKIAHVALSRVTIDLDDGVKVNYEKVQKGPDGKSLGILAKI